MMISVDLQGIDNLMGKLDSEIESFIVEVENIIEDTTQLVFTESQLEVPVDTGLLKNSGLAHPPIRDKDGIEGRVTYSTDYAYWVHEILHYRHAEGTKAKYLEDPIKRHDTDFQKRIRKAIEDYFRR